MNEMENPKTVFEEAVMARLEVIERQNQQILALLAKMADSSSVDLPAPSGRRGGKYTPEQWQAIVKDPRILREMSRQDTSKRRKKALATRHDNTAGEQGKPDYADQGGGASA